MTPVIHMADPRYETLMKSTISSLFSLLFATGAFLATAQAAVLDTLRFGDAASELAHAFTGESSGITTGALDQPARVANLLASGTAGRAGDLAFTVKVDPASQNYLTVKFWGEDTAGLSLVDIDGRQIGYHAKGDYEPLNAANGKALPGRFYYATILLPHERTVGRSSVPLTIRTYLGKAETTSRAYYQAYVHTESYLDFSAEKQGVKPTTTVPVSSLLAPAPTDSDTRAFLEKYREAQLGDLQEYAAKVDASADAKLSIVRYQDELRIYANLLKQPWSTAHTPAEKRLGLERIFKSIDNHVQDYYADTRLVTRGGHQGDWGGYYGALGEALYIVDGMINDPAIYGSAEFTRLLDQPFATGTTAGEFSLASVDWDGNALTRRAAWERVLKANFDFARSRLSYIYNQMLYTYEGAWEAHEGLRVIGSRHFEGKPRSHQIFRESLGISPFLGEEVLVGPDGQDLDLYHSLFRHDREAEFTTDFLQIVAKGLARSKLDASGQVVRRRPYGGHYLGITEAGLTRENGYVGNYGESANYLPEYVYHTWNQPGDEVLHDDILKLALRNLHARGYTRYTALDDDGHRIMRMQQVLDERNPAYPGMLAYATRLTFGRALLYASLEKHMADHPDRYAGPDWADTWRYAAEAVGFAQQQLADHQLISNPQGAKGMMSSRKLDFRLPETYTYLTEDRATYPRFGKQVSAGVVHPLTDFDYYTPAELENLRVNPADYARFAWVDLDNMMVVLRDGPVQLSGILNFRNRGFSGSGRLHVVSPNYEHLTQIAVRAKFQYRDYYLRMNDYHFDFMVGNPAGDGPRPQALAGEVCPITYQPGVGPVVRDNFELDHPYTSLPDYAQARYGTYLIALNTTRPEHGNTRSFDVELPADHTSATVLDLVSGRTLPVVSGKVVLAPKSALVLRLDSAREAAPVPAPVAFVAALPGQGSASLTWKPAAGALSYTITRAADEAGPYTTLATGITATAHTDPTAPVGSPTFYQIIAVNAAGSAWPSYRARLDLAAPASLPPAASPWRDDRIGTSKTGTATVTGNTIAIAGADGTGLGAGNDYKIDTRDIRDSLHFVSQPVNGGFTITAKLESATGPLSGLLLRDQLQPNTRYLHLGADAEGKLVLQNRTRDTRHEVSMKVISPQRIELPGFTIASHPFLKLTRDASTHIVTAFASADGSVWTEVGALFTPFPQTIHVGLAATREARFTGVEIER